MSKAVIGGLSDVEARADSEQGRADRAASDLTMTRRRIRTFYDALSQVQFPADAPSWAPNWKEWLLTGEVVKAEAPEVLATEAEVDVAADFPVDIAVSDPAAISPEDVVVETPVDVVDETPVG